MMHARVMSGLGKLAARFNIEGGSGRAHGFIVLGLPEAATMPQEATAPPAQERPN